MKLLITGGGSLVGMHHDSLHPLAERLGELEINRASNVEWSGTAWQATCVSTGEVFAEAPTRKEALQKEHTVIESRLLEYA